MHTLMAPFSERFTVAIDMAIECDFLCKRKKVHVSVIEARHKHSGFVDALTAATLTG